MPRVALLDCDGPGNAGGDSQGDISLTNEEMAANLQQWLTEPGDDDDGDGAWEWTTFRVKTKGELPRADDFDAFIMPGSRSNVTDGEEWMEPLGALLRDVHSQGKPLVGICFGNQMLAAALGGRVASRGSFNCAIDAIVTTPAAADYSIEGSAENPLRLFKGHSQEVVELPPGASLLGSSDSTAVELWAIGNTVLGCQGHPDFGAELSTRLVPEMEAIGLLDADAAATLAAGMQPDHPTPVANDLFKLRIREVLSGECRAVQQSKL
jgi:GMP synthase-like glutamine amidotransferase